MQKIQTWYTYLRETADLTPNKFLFGDATRKISALETLALSEHLAARFLSAGIKAGDYVALRAHRNVVTVLALVGLRAIGAVAVLTDPRRPCNAFLTDCLLPLPITAIVEQTEGTRFSVTTADGVSSFDLFALPPVRLSLDARDPSEPSFVIFTSGSTGAKKAVVLPESALICNLIDSAPLGDYSTQDVALGALPLDHVFGLALLTGVFVLRYALFLPKETDVSALLRTIDQEKITRMNGVPSLYLAMCEQAEDHDLSSLRAGFIGGSPIGADRLARIEETLGMTLIPVYGMSECIGISCADAHDSLRVRAEGVGRIYPMNTGAILLPSGREAGPNEEGEICVKGPMRMLGYFGQPLSPDEWLHTGDLGYLDANGVLHLCGRIKDIIIRNGYNLAPTRIENALLSLPGVKAAAVVGLDDPLQGEVPAAMVVSDRDEAALLKELSDRLQKNELPVLIQTVEALPMTASGKPDKTRIREILNKHRNG